VLGLVTKIRYDVWWLRILRVWETRGASPYESALLINALLYFGGIAVTFLAGTRDLLLDPTISLLTTGRVGLLTDPGLFLFYTLFHLDFTVALIGGWRLNKMAWQMFDTASNTFAMSREEYDKVVNRYFDRAYGAGGRFILWKWLLSSVAVCFFVALFWYWSLTGLRPLYQAPIMIYITLLISITGLFVGYAAYAVPQIVYVARDLAAKKINHWTIEPQRASWLKPAQNLVLSMSLFWYVGVALTLPVFFTIRGFPFTRHISLLAIFLALVMLGAAIFFGSLRYLGKILSNIREDALAKLTKRFQVLYTQYLSSISQSQGKCDSTVLDELRTLTALISEVEKNKTGPLDPATAIKFAATSIPAFGSLLIQLLR
jgi:hypothetical protein